MSSYDILCKYSATGGWRFKKQSRDSWNTNVTYEQSDRQVYINFRRAANQSWRFNRASFKKGSNTSSLGDQTTVGTSGFSGTDKIYSSHHKYRLDAKKFTNGRLRLRNRIYSRLTGSFYFSIAFQAKDTQGQNTPWSDDPMIDDKGSAGTGQTTPRRRMVLKLRRRRG